MISEGVSLRFKENRFRVGDFRRISAASCRTGSGGFGEGAGLYVCGLRIKSGSGSASEDCCTDSDSEACSPYDTS